MAWTDPIIFFTKFWGVFDSYWGWVFTDALKNSETFTSENHNLFFWGFGCFTGFFFSFPDFLKQTEELGQSEPKLQLSWWRCWWMMLDAGWLVGNFFSGFSCGFFVITWKNANDSVVFSQKNSSITHLHKCPEQKRQPATKKKKHSQHNLFFFSKKKKFRQKSILPLFPSTNKNIPAKSGQIPKNQISGSWDKLDTPLPCIAWIWFSSSGLTQASWAPKRGSEFCLGWPEIHWNPRNQLSFWQFFLIFREFLMRIKRWFVFKKTVISLKKKEIRKEMWYTNQWNAPRIAKKTTFTTNDSSQCTLSHQNLHLRKLTWNPKMEVWKMIFLFNWVICRFHVNFQGCNCQGFHPG